MTNSITTTSKIQFTREYLLKFKPLFTTPSIELKLKLFRIFGKKLKGVTEAKSIAKLKNQYSSPKWAAAKSSEEFISHEILFILNKLTPEKYNKILQRLLRFKIRNEQVLQQIIRTIHGKAIQEQHYSALYATLCSDLSQKLPVAAQGPQPTLFKELLLTLCQEQFEQNDENTQNKEDEQRKLKLSKIGNVVLIGELYKKKMLGEKVVHLIIKELLTTQSTEHVHFELLCKLLPIVGSLIDNPKAKKLVDVYFSKISQFEQDSKLPSRIRFMLKDLLELRQKNWVSQKQTSAVKTISDVHKDVENEKIAMERKTLQILNQKRPRNHDAPRKPLVPIPARAEPKMPSVALANKFTLLAALEEPHAGSDEPCDESETVAEEDTRSSSPSANLESSAPDAKQIRSIIHNFFESGDAEDAWADLKPLFTTHLSVTLLFMIKAIIEDNSSQNRTEAVQLLISGIHQHLYTIPEALDAASRCFDTLLQNEAHIEAPNQLVNFAHLCRDLKTKSIGSSSQYEAFLQQVSASHDFTGTNCHKKMIETLAM